MKKEMAKDADNTQYYLIFLPLLIRVYNGSKIATKALRRMSAVYNVCLCVCVCVCVCTSGAER